MRTIVRGLGRAVADSLERGVEFRAELHIRRIDGVVRWISTAGQIFRDPDGRPVRMLSVTRDITEGKQADAPRETVQRSEKLRALGQMASGIAHDINQSLMLVASYSDLARQALALSSPDLTEVEDLMATTTQAALDCGETVKRLLLFTRSAPEHDHQPVDLSKVVRDAAQLTAPRWRDAAQTEGRPISLDVNTSGTPTIHGSPSHLRELMTNLIFNAVEALPAGGSIRVRVAAEEGRAVIEVVDSGVGMSAEVRDRVFEPFFTTKGQGATGLGLAIVFGLVEQHGGHIEVRSAPGDGTTFRASFPLVEPQGQAQPSLQPPVQSLQVLAMSPATRSR
jgi:signal transduction histidine kinase